MTREEINKLMQELAEYSKLEQEISVQIETIKDSLKREMESEGLTELLSDQGHKCYYKPTVSSRVDSTAFKKAGYKELYDSFCKPCETRPFRFYA